MPSVTSKRVLKDDSNVLNKGPQDSVKKRKLDVPSNGAATKENRVPRLSQQKSSFEGDLERFTQEMNGLKGGGAPRPQDHDCMLTEA